jgi:hypothetical protein
MGTPLAADKSLLLIPIVQIGRQRPRPCVAGAFVCFGSWNHRLLFNSNFTKTASK